MDEQILDSILTLCELSLKRLSGTSGPCQTFGNLCLAHKEEFELKNVEVRPALYTLS